MRRQRSSRDDGAGLASRHVWAAAAAPQPGVPPRRWSHRRCPGTAAPPPGPVRPRCGDGHPRHPRTQAVASPWLLLAGRAACCSWRCWRMRCGDGSTAANHAAGPDRPRGGARAAGGGARIDAARDARASSPSRSPRRCANTSSAASGDGGASDDRGIPARSAGLVATPAWRATASCSANSCSSATSRSSAAGT